MWWALPKPGAQWMCRSAFLVARRGHEATSSHLNLSGLQLMGTLREPLQLWQVGVAASETAPLLVNSSVPGTSAGLWNCTASKAVYDIAPGARMKKYTGVE